MNSILVMSIWQGVGYQMIIFIAGLNGISQELYEAAAIDGANSVKKFFYITLPGLRNVISFIVVYVTIQAFKVFTQPYIMTFGGPQNSTRDRNVEATLRDAIENREVVDYSAFQSDALLSYNFLLL